MSLLLKDQWHKWAHEWGLTHYPEKGWVRRTESVLGARKGLLFRVAWGKDEDPGLHVCIRFPRIGEPQRLRESLIADSSLDALPGRGAGRRKMEIQTGPKKAVRISQWPEFLLAENCLIWRRRFAFKTPSAVQVQAWVDTLIEAITRVTPKFAAACETCATGHAEQYVVVDGLPMMMCATCQQRLKTEGEMADRAYEMIEVRHLQGTALGLVAVAIGAIAWAGVGALTQRIFAMGAIGIGALIAFAYRHGAGRVDVTGRVIAACLTLASVVLGEVLLLSWWISQRRPDIGFNLDAGWLTYLGIWKESPGEEIVPIFFGLIGAWVASQALEKPKLAAKVERAGGPGADDLSKAA